MPRPDRPHPGDDPDASHDAGTEVEVQTVNSLAQFDASMDEQIFEALGMAIGHIKSQLADKSFKGRTALAIKFVNVGMHRLEARVKAATPSAPMAGTGDLESTLSKLLDQLPEERRYALVRSKLQPQLTTTEEE